MKYEVKIKRVYDEQSTNDGSRFLVDRLWPRGVKKSALAGVMWLKEVAPTTPLRKWFGHEPAKWVEFRKRYRKELEKNPGAWQPLLKASKKGDITLLFSTRETEKNHAVVLKEFLKGKAHEGHAQ